MVLRFLVLVLLAAVPAAPRPCPAGDPAAGTARTRLLARLDSLFVSDERDTFASLLIRELAAARTADDTATVLPLLIRQGQATAMFGGGAGCEPVLREATRMAEARGDTALLAVACRWLGVAVENQGRPDEALALYERCLALARAAGDRRTQAWALIGRAWHAYRAGRADAGLADYRAAGELMAAAGDERGEAWTCNGEGICLVVLGRYGEALERYRTAARRAAALGYDHLEGLALNNLGGLEYSLGDPGRALAAFRRATAIQTRLGHHREAVIPAKNRALCLAALGRTTAAADSLTALLRICRARGYADLEAGLLVQMAATRRQQDRPHLAVALLREALARPLGLDRWEEIEARGDLARALAALDSVPAALEVLAAAPRSEGGRDRSELVLDLLIGRLLLRDGRPAEALARVRGVSGAAREAGLNGYLVESESLGGRAWRCLGEPDSALACLERAAAAWERERAVPLEPEWREARGAAARLVATELADLLLAADDGAAVAFDRLQRFKGRTLRERLTGPGRRGDGGTCGPPARLAELQREVLAPGELLLDAHLGPERSFLFAVTRHECRTVRWPPADELGRRLHVLLGLLAPPAEGDPDPAGGGDAAAATAAALGKILLGGVQDLLAAADHVIFSPAGEANLLPDALLARPGVRWTRVPSATLLADLRRRPAAPDGPAGPLLAWGGRGAGPEDRLPAAAREVEALALRYRDVRRPAAPSVSPGDGPSGEGGDRVVDATAALAGAGILHFAAHARIDDDAPWQSSLLLGERELRAARIAGCRLDARLAVMAGCSSARGRAVGGEGVQGLSSAFLAAGVPAVVATLWPVEDETAARLVDRLYAGLADGLPAAEALGAAQACLRRDPRTGHPAHWAAFVLVGDGEVRVPLRRRPWTPARLWGELGLLSRRIAGSDADLPLGPGRSAGGALMLAGLAVAGLLAGGRRPRRAAAAGAAGAPGSTGGARGGAAPDEARDFAAAEASMTARQAEGLPDETLLRLAIADPGSDESRLAAWRLLARHRQRVYAWCFRMLRDHDRALDLAQDVLLLAYRKLESFAGRSRFESWLFAVCRNRCLSELRRPCLLRDDEADPDGFPTGRPDPEEQLLESLDLERLLLMMRERLDEQERQALWLRCLERMPVPAITEILGIGDRSGARAVLQRARRKLRQALREREGE